MRTLNQILVDVNSYIDLDATLPTGTELTTRVSYANQAILDAAATGQFPEFHSSYVVDPATLASISMPAMFREFESSPKQLTSDGLWNEFEVIKPLDRYGKNLSARYCYLLGNPAGGYTAVFNNLTANATLSFDYQRYPSGLATLSDICELPDPQYVVAKTESYILQSRSDDRFPIVEADAQRRLGNMLGRTAKNPAGGTGSTPKRGVASYSIGS